MFNLLVSGTGWTDRRETMPAGRAFEYTDDEIVERFKPGGEFDVEALKALPSLFMSCLLYTSPSPRDS